MIRGDKDPRVPFSSYVSYASFAGFGSFRDDLRSLIVLQQRLAAANIRLDGRLICFEICHVHVELPWS